MATSKVKTTTLAGRTIFLIFAAAILLASLLYTVLTLQSRENISSKRSQAQTIGPAICPEVTFIVGSTPPQCGVSCANKPSNYCLAAVDGCTVCDVASGCRLPQCGEPCTTSSQCPQGCNSCNGPLNFRTCQGGPTPTIDKPTPTQPPQCGASCANKPSNYCLSNAVGGCTACDVSSGCRPPKCGEPCANSNNCLQGGSGCNVCSNGVCTSGPTVTPTKPPACGVSCENKPSNYCLGAPGCQVCAGPIGSRTCKPGILTPTPTPSSQACDKTKPNSRWATDLGLITSGGIVRFAKGWPYFDPSGKTFLVNIPSGKSVAFIACYDCDHWGSGSGGWKINWNGGSFVAKTPNNTWGTWKKSISGPKTVKFDGNGDSHGGNICINP